MAPEIIENSIEKINLFVNNNLYLILIVTGFVFLLFLVYLIISKRNIKREFTKLFEDKTPIFRKKAESLKRKRNKLSSDKLGSLFSELVRNYFNSCLNIEGEYTFEELSEKMAKEDKRKFIDLSSRISNTIYSEESLKKEKILELLEEFIVILEKEETKNNSGKRKEKKDKLKKSEQGQKLKKPGGKNKLKKNRGKIKGENIPQKLEESKSEKLKIEKPVKTLEQEKQIKKIKGENLVKKKGGKSSKLKKKKRIVKKRIVKKSKIKN